ncbi:MAG: Na+/H+ antiporter subunit E [Coriobacteriia bacterium]|nr:Na+/H+ antiporter subunit E [Coriobacteriia bacterium]
MRRVLSVAVMFVFWLAIIGSIKPFDLLLGLIFSAAIAYWADRALWAGEPEPLSGWAWLRFPRYFVWLLKEIVVAALYVAEWVLNPRLTIEPKLHTHRVHFERDTARVAFANSITLTPGTITIDVSEDTYVIHCLHQSFSDSISSGDLEHRVSGTFDG